jgi:membrane dipeptidase
MFIVDAHLDLSYNALRGRDVLAPADKQPADDEGIPSVGLPDLRAGGVGLICATIFCLPVDEKHAGYRTADEARDVALHHLAWYRNQVSDGRMRLACRPNDLSANENAAQAAILLMEGADPLRSPREVDERDCGSSALPGARRCMLAAPQRPGRSRLWGGKQSRPWIATA